jgi:hypothetical protein
MMDGAPWTTSETISAIIPAFVQVLHEVQDVQRNRQADIKSDKGSHSYKYADLATVLESVKPVLATHGLAITQSAFGAGEVTTILLHESGEWIAFAPLTVKPMQSTPQAIGSAISYARRYSALALLNIATEDDDGKTANEPVREHPNSKRVADVRRDLNRLPKEVQVAARQWATEERHKQITPGALLDDAGWLTEVENWVDEQTQPAPAAVPS